uniref:AIG1-type G domain-containing protein n=1 Tax=Amphimedon queenslandica TaxID=400682 RepID=A0A1X7VRL5_AMPQE
MGDQWNSNLDVQDDVEIQPVTFPNENIPRVPLEEPQATILQEEHKEKLGNKPVHILFTGLAGAGKSTLVNVMLAKVLAQTGCGPDSIKASKSYYEGEFEGVQLRVYDTYGYSTESNHKIPKSDSFDLILICIKITNRLSDSEIKLLKALGKALDKEAWKRTVIVLTFANLLLQDSKIKYLASEEAKCQAMKDLMEDYKRSITKHLEGHMDKETAHSIPFCLAGESHPHDPTIKGVRKLPTTEDWLVDLWETCANRVNPEIRSWFDRLIEIILELLSRIKERRQQQQHDEKIELKEHAKQRVEEKDNQEESNHIEL